MMTIKNVIEGQYEVQEIFLKKLLNILEKFNEAQQKGSEKKDDEEKVEEDGVVDNDFATEVIIPLLNRTGELDIQIGC